MTEETLIAGVQIQTANDFRLQRWTPLVVFVGSIVVSIAFLAVLPGRFRANDSSDYLAQYEPVARSILAGRGFVVANGEFATLYPPGYSVILAAVYGVSRTLGWSEQFGVAATSVLAMALISVFLFLLTRMLFGTRPAAFAAALWSTYPFALWMLKQPNSELPFMVLFYGGIGLFAYALARGLSWKMYFGCGLLFGLSMLIRPIAIGIPFVACAIVGLAYTRTATKSRVLIMAALLVGSFLAVLPWQTLAYAKTGHVMPLATNGVRSVRDGLTYGVVTRGYRSNVEVPQDVADLMQRIVTQGSSANSLRELASVVTKLAGSHPIAMGKLIVMKIVRSWYGTDSGRGEAAVLILQVLYLAFIAWGIRRVWSAGPTYRLFAVGALLVTIYFWGMTVLVLSIFRYMLPVMPLLFMLLGAAVSSRISRSQTVTSASA